jgi:glutathione S-transferase
MNAVLYGPATPRQPGHVAPVAQISPPCPFFDAIADHSRFMASLYHFPICPHSRFARVVLGELSFSAEMIEERPWQRRRAFLEMNPAGTLPVFVEESGLAAVGTGPFSEYMDEVRGLALGAARLMPENPAERLEVRRLLDWFNTKFFDEVSGPIVLEKAYKRLMSNDDGGGPPDTSAIRAAKTNIRYHLKYIGWLAGRRNWLAGDVLTYADLAAAAQLSVVDYFGDVPWDEDEIARAWYARVKSRPGFRTLLADRLAGMMPAAHYEDLDF